MDKCSELVPNENGWGVRACSRNGKFEIDGKRYCGIHNPQRKKALDDEREARWRAGDEIREEQHRRLSRYDEAIRLLRECVAWSGISDTPGIDWLDLQVDREAYASAIAFLAAEPATKDQA